MLKPVALWRTWDEPDRQIAVAHWTERDISVVFPLAWAARKGQAQMIGVAKDRIRTIEGRSGKALAPGSVLLAFSTHEEQPALHQLAPEIPRALI